MDNKLYEFGGVVDLLIKCKTPMTIAGKSYQAGEPYTYLKDVVIDFDYTSDERVASGTKSAAVSRVARPNVVTFYNIPFNTKILNLVFLDQADNVMSTFNEGVTCWEQGKLQLQKPCAGNIWCYDHNLELVNCAVDTTDNSVLIGDFVETSYYTVFYSTVWAGTEYSFEAPLYPYFELEIYSKGNKDKHTTGIYMHFYAASFVTTPRFNVRNGIFDIPLRFQLIYVGQKEPIIGVI